jgi:phosphoribosylglycinamide formyltransferase 1
MNQKSVAILVSGRGSNMESLIKYSLNKSCPYKISLVISNKPHAIALEKAEQYKIPAFCVKPSDYKSKIKFETKIIEHMEDHNIEIVALAGFMRIVGATLLNKFPNAVLNIHPSLLPSFTGLNAQKQAIDHGVKFSGCTVHLVDGGMDTGIILGQRSLIIEDKETEESLSKRILHQEHILYPEILSKFSMGEFRFNERISSHGDISSCHPETLELFKKLHYGDVAEEAYSSITKSGKKALGVSACLLGIPCRYDGKAKPYKLLNRFDIFKLVPICPEVLANFGIPRVSMEYKIGDGSTLATDGVLEDLNGQNTNSPMIKGCEEGIEIINRSKITHAFIKARSPSCGNRSIHRNGEIVSGVGRFAHLLVTKGISIISEEEEHLIEEFIKSAKM